MITVISGGQTGVDIAAVDAAIERGFSYGGTVPKNRRIEKGTLDKKYTCFKESTSGKYEVRTKQNIEDAHGTLILTKGVPTGGTLLTIKYAERINKPHLIINPYLDRQVIVKMILRFIVNNGTIILNVAGPRESKIPGIYEQSKSVMLDVLARIKKQ